MYKGKSFEKEMFYGAKPDIFEKAKQLRGNLTKAEKVLWNELRLKKLKNYRFKVQHPIDIFIADFYCHKAKLVVEIDGGIHNLPDQKEYDEGREYELEDFGIKLIRFTNEQVFNDLEIVIKAITSELP